MRLCTVVRDSPSRRAICAVEARASSRRTDNRRSSAGEIFTLLTSIVDSTKLPEKPSRSQLPYVQNLQIMGIDKSLLEMSMTILGPLAPLRAHAGSRLTTGLDDAAVERLAAAHPDLTGAIHAAAREYDRIRKDIADLLDLDEKDQIAAMQAGFVNFYADDAVVPYIALAACGPWVVSLKGAVLYDAGGYGMLGFGHTPADIMAAAAKPQVMADRKSTRLNSSHVKSSYAVF